jgi:DNA-binding transcriptional LysR family regulator
VSQSALSQTVLSLERQLGVQLLQRHSTGVTVTEAGTILLREGRALIALAPPGWADPLPSAPLPGVVTWHPLIGSPIIRRTWAVWPASSRRRDLAALIAALDVTIR